MTYDMLDLYLYAVCFQGQDSSDDDEDDVLTVLAEERFKVTSLEKMINIIAILVESSRVFRNLQLSDKDMDLLVGGKVGYSC